MNKIVSETIDGSIKDIIQLKTLDNSLEFSQMYDALEGCPDDFKRKLIDALNSLGESMKVEPVDVFNKVLCKSDDDDEDLKKKLYDWWRGVFEVLGDCNGNIPKERESEYNEKVDGLMAEILKDGDSVSSDGNSEGEVVAEDYEAAELKDEDDLKKSMQFATQHLGTIAAKVQELVNFVNPYCGEKVDESGLSDEIEVREFVKAIGFRPDPDGIDYETQLVDALTGKDTSYNAGWGAVYYNSDKVLQFLKKFGMLGSRGIKQKEAISKLKRLFKTGKWKEPEQTEMDLMNEVDNNMNKINEKGGDSEWVSMDEITNMKIGESDDGEAELVYITKAEADKLKDLIKKDLQNVSLDKAADMALEHLRWITNTDVAVSNPDEVIINFTDDSGMEDDFAVADQQSMSVYEFVKDVEGGMSWSPKFKVGDKVTWIDPDGGEAKEGWTVTSAPENEEEDDDVYTIETDDGSEAEVLGSELRPASVMMNEENLENELNKGDDGWKEVGQPVGEATVTVNADDVWEVLELLDDETAKKNLTDLINSHVRAEEEIMDAIDTFVEKTWGRDDSAVSKSELNKMFSKWMSDIVQELGLDVEKFKKGGQFVDPEKPVALESDWDEKPAEREEAHDKPERGTKAIVNGQVVDADSGYAEFMRIANMEPRRRHWEESVGWKDYSEKLTAAELCDSLLEYGGSEGSDLLVQDAFDGERGSKITVSVITKVEDKDEIKKLVNDRLLGNVENWEVDKVGKAKKDEGGLFNTEVLLKQVVKDDEEPLMEENGNNDEAKPEEVKMDKKFKTDDGTKTLVSGSKNVVSEMTIEQEVNDPWKLLDLLWGQGKENFDELLRSNLFSDDRIMSTLEEFDVRDLTNLNDLLAYDFEQVLDAFGCDVEAWTQHLEIQKL